MLIHSRVRGRIHTRCWCRSCVVTSNRQQGNTTHRQLHPTLAQGDQSLTFGCGVACSCIALQVKQGNHKWCVESVVSNSRTPPHCEGHFSVDSAQHREMRAISPTLHTVDNKGLKFAPLGYQFHSISPARESEGEWSGLARAGQRERSDTPQG